MVLVPQVSRQVGGSVQLQAPGVTPVQDQTGRQLQQAGQGMQNLGQGVQRLGTVITEENDTARAQEAFALLSEHVRQKLNPMDGYRSQLGKSAGDSYDSVREELETKRKELAGTLQNDAQRQAFDGAARSRLGQGQGVIDTHAAEQTRVYGLAQKVAMLKANKAIYQDGLGDADVMIKALAMVKRDVEGIAEDTGMPPEAEQQLFKEHLAEMHANAISSAIESGDTVGARQYLNQFSGDLTGKVRKSLSKSVKVAEDNAFAQKRVSGISGDTKGDLQVLRSIAQEFRQGKISPERAEAASVAARQRMDAVTVEKDAIRSIAVATIRGSAGSFEQLTGEERQVVIAAGFEDRAKSWMSARASGQPTPALEQGEAKRVVTQLSDLSPLEIRQVFSEKTTSKRYEQISSVVGLDWEKHQTTVKGMIDAAYGEDTPEAKVQSLNTEIRQMLTPNLWARAVIGPGGLPRGQGAQNPLNEAVVRGMKEMILERTRQDPALSTQEAMDQVNDILIKSVMFDGQGVLADTKIPYPMMKYIDADDASKATNTSIGIPYRDIEINFIDIGDIDGGKSGGMPPHVFDHYASKEPDFEKMSPQDKSKYALLFARDWVSKNRPKTNAELQKLEAIDAQTLGDPDMRISSSITPAPIQAMAALYVDGDTVAIPDFKEFIGAVNVPDNMLGYRMMFPGVPEDTMRKEDDYKKLVAHLKAIKKSIELDNN